MKPEVFCAMIRHSERADLCPELGETIINPLDPPIT
jgi:hypothetical protein